MKPYALLLQAGLRPDIPAEAFWAIITLLVGVIVWVAIRYISKLDVLLERLDTAVDEIKATLKLQGQRLDNHENEIKSLKDSNKNRRR